MRKAFLLLSAVPLLASMSMSLSAQQAIDAYSLSRYSLRGTARFMSMAGAYGALGGDMSSMTINPAGLGVYRSSEVGATLDIDIQSLTSNTNGAKTTDNRTRVACNNFGYVGSAYTGSDLFPYFNWGATYNRVASFDRRFRGKIDQMNGSLSNYIAGFTTADAWPSNYLLDNPNDANPYLSSDRVPWMSIMAYNTYMINQPNPNASNPEYAGLWQNGTTGKGSFDVDEKGHVDEYEISFGGNFSDIVYVGIGFGITDIEYKQNIYYQEDFNNACISNPSANGVETGDGGYGLENWKRITGTGFNFKAGVIVKPINELRLGFAVHTPTYYNLTSEHVAAIDFGYSSGVTYYNDSKYYQTNDGYTMNTDWKLRTPWRLMASVAGVIGGQGIISLDYEYRPTQDIRMLTNGGDELTDFNNDCRTYYQASNIIRLGGEYRIDRNWSVRAGYSYESAPVTTHARDGYETIYTSGLYDMSTQPSYTFDSDTYHITCGLGYRYQNFYADAAYVYRHNSSTWRAWTPSDYTALPPSSEISASSSQIVLSLGFRF